jgi:hypothetical protein
MFYDGASGIVISIARLYLKLNLYMELEYNVQAWRGYWMVHKWTGGRLPEVSYKVTENRKGGLDCACASGRYRGYCKHTEMVREYIKADKEGRLDNGMFFIKG